MRVRILHKKWLLTLPIPQYLKSIRAKFATDDATEHSYRPALEALFESIGKGLTAVNEPKRVACGAPDFVIKHNTIDIGHCEAKDLHVDLKKLKDENLAQKNRYLKALPNLVYTNGLDFEFYKSGQKIRSVSIAALSGGKITPLPENFAALSNQLAAFAAERPQTIATAKKLAEMMAGKAVLIKDIMGRALKADAHLATELTGQYKAFKAHLIHDISAEDFADIYAETIAYGLFAARLHDTSLDTFSRAEAMELLPKSNPFLRSLFGYIAGVDLDDRIAWVIDELCEVLRACDVQALMQDFGRWTARNDPFLHFYETFLAEYNPTKRKARGVWYTPEPVVNFIVRAVDDVLKTEFGLPLGLADTSKITIDWDGGQGKSFKKQVHRVQILDPATGTGTFLAEAVKQIAAQVKGVAEGMWSSYVEQDLIPRLHGFELLMASYAMCHMKLDMMLADLGYKPTATPPRLGVYLTNSLEEGETVAQDLFAQWLANEAKSASEIKRQMPIMCVIGNPPYSGESANKGDWIMGLMEAYKKEPGGNSRLDERNPKWINDDYVKFIRFAEHMIAKTGEGVLGFITNHGYLDNPTFRGMRWHLLNTFDKIYVLDLHGNAKKKEVSPDGTADKNVFDIQQGVAIVIAVKKAATGPKTKRLALLRHSELWGTREGKYSALWENKVRSIDWTAIRARAPHYSFVERKLDKEAAYLKGFGINELFQTYSLGIATARDEFSIKFSSDELRTTIETFKALSNEDARSHFTLGKDSRDWKIALAREDLRVSEPLSEKISRLDYRPFDTRYTVYTGRTKGFHCMPRYEVMKHFMRRPNFGISFNRRVEESRPFTDVFVFDKLIQLHSLSLKEVNSIAPLYLYPDPNCFDTARRTNFDPKIYTAICKAANLTGADGDELLVFDYIYGVLHSPDYRRAYAQFLKIDFPRIPYPLSPQVFAHIADKGGQLRRLHLMEDAAIGATPCPFNGQGAGVVDKIVYTDAGRVHINPQQWFENVSRTAWEFRIGGYQPAQKWLKDRKGRALSFDDVRHYQKIIKILNETDRIMKEIILPP